MDGKSVQHGSPLEKCYVLSEIQCRPVSRSRRKRLAIPRVCKNVEQWELTAGANSNDATTLENSLADFLEAVHSTAFSSSHPLWVFT